MRRAGNWGAELALALEASELAVHLIRSSSSREILDMKAPNDYATEVDIAVERAVAIVLREKSPHPVQGEESSTEEESPTRWVVDPIDGTFNFVSSIPLVAFSIALLNDGRPVVAVVASIQSNEVFSATEGGGAFLNGSPLSTTREPIQTSAVLVGDFSSKSSPVWSNAARGRVIHALGESVGRVRMIGTAATDLAWVAAGRAVGSITFANHAWDVCAGILLVSEAGGTVLDGHGEPWDLTSDSVLAASSTATAESIAALSRSLASV